MRRKRVLGFAEPFSIGCQFQDISRYEKSALTAAPFTGWQEHPSPNQNLSLVLDKPQEPADFQQRNQGRISG
jgi:hypothetical protein